MGETIDTYSIRQKHQGECRVCHGMGADCEAIVYTHEIDRLRAANEHLADALADIADGECSRMDHRRCHNVYPAEPYEWCPTCVAVVGWSAWSMGVTR